MKIQQFCNKAANRVFFGAKLDSNLCSTAIDCRDTPSWILRVSRLLVERELSGNAKTSYVISFGVVLVCKAHERALISSINFLMTRLQVSPAAWCRRQDFLPYSMRRLTEQISAARCGC